MKIVSTPKNDKYYMPAEFARHRGCVMIWPVRPGSWPYGGKEAQESFSQIARAIAHSERVWMLADGEHIEEVKRAFADDNNIEAVLIETDDSWARDVGPTCVVKSGSAQENERSGSAQENERSCSAQENERSCSAVRGINWSFNAWGGEYDGLYASWDKDDAAAIKICDELGMDYYDAAPFVLEGGSIHSDGEGTILVTEACLLSKGRNPELSKAQIEAKLKEYLGAEKVIWLPNGIYNDETNEHVDNVCAFTAPGEVVLAWTDDKEDPQYPMSLASLEVLERETDARGRRIKVHKLPIPAKPVCVTEQELMGYEFEEGEDVREAGERLAASYVNFYISNGGVVVPQFGDEMDAEAIRILGELFPGRTVYPIRARAIIVGGGNIHCITQQIPE